MAKKKSKNNFTKGGFLKLVRCKNGQFLIEAKSSNGNILSSTEQFKTRNGAIKNIVAHMKAFNSEYVIVKDFTNKIVNTLSITKFGEITIL